MLVFIQQALCAVEIPRSNACDSSGQQISLYSTDRFLAQALVGEKHEVQFIGNAVPSAGNQGDIFRRGGARRRTLQRCEEKRSAKYWHGPASLGVFPQEITPRRPAPVVQSFEPDQAALKTAILAQVLNCSDMGVVAKGVLVTQIFERCFGADQSPYSQNVSQRCRQGSLKACRNLTGKLRHDAATIPQSSTSRLDKAPCAGQVPQSHGPVFGRISFSNELSPQVPWASWNKPNCFAHHRRCAKASPFAPVSWTSSSRPAASRASSGVNAS